MNIWHHSGSVFDPKKEAPQLDHPEAMLNMQFPKSPISKWTVDQAAWNAAKPRCRHCRPASMFTPLISGSFTCDPGMTSGGSGHSTNFALGALGFQWCDLHQLVAPVVLKFLFELSAFCDWALSAFNSAIVTKKIAKESRWPPSYSMSVGFYKVTVMTPSYNLLYKHSK